MQPTHFSHGGAKSEGLDEDISLALLPPLDADGVCKCSEVLMSVFKLRNAFLLLLFNSLEEFWKESDNGSLRFD
jgi:hypothetical protein